MTYSIAIRTLGTGGENYRRELESIVHQTVQPERVVVYIADGHARPKFTIGHEEYVWVPKGMVAQRALPYTEIGSEYVLLLDDDVELAPDTAERLLRAAAENHADCVAADTFCNHRMSRTAKLRAAMANCVLPSRRQHCAFRIRRSGAFSYLSHPLPGGCYPSESAAGPAALWRRLTLLDMHLEHELWLEQDGFAYGDDMVEFHKLHVNNRLLFVLFDSGAGHLDSGSISGTFRKGNRRMYVRTKNSFITWWRCVYEPAPEPLAVLCFSGRMLWSLIVACGVLQAGQFLTGLRDGIRFVRSNAYKKIPAYKLS